MTAVVGLLIALAPLAYSMFSTPPEAPHHAVQNQTGQAPSDEPVTSGDAAAATVSVERRVECPSSGVGAASGATGTGDSELANLRLPCLTTGGTELEASLAEQWAGKPTVVNVWAWWCVPCREELPVIEEVAERNDQWNVVGVHLDPNAQAGADFLAETGVENLASYQDSSHQFDAATGIPKVVPVTVIYDENGHRVATFVETFDNVEDMESKIQEALQS